VIGRRGGRLNPRKRGEAPQVRGLSRVLPRGGRRDDTLLSGPVSGVRSKSLVVPSPPIVPSDGVMPRPLSTMGSLTGDVPVRVVPVRAELLLVRDDALRRVPDERLLVFFRPVERDAVFLRAPVERLLVFLRPVERDAVFLRAPVERLLVFLRPVERDAVFLRAPVERLLVFLRPVERDAVFLRPPDERVDLVLRAAVERVVVRRALVERERAVVLRRVVPLLERVLEVFLRALAIRAPPR
jgi:hypothetical protein